ncbi:MAG: YdeI/OmpD-associated family protein [Bacteroidia bacterium]|jgi:hypothetical protein|nr:YdeI/OmpD-associated family protein [Bacteroidia bacterium]
MTKKIIPLIKGEFLLEKFEGKGGWTFARLPLELNRKTPFGWVRVKGMIDDYEISQFHLMPMGNGFLFLSVKADIRKKIKKQAGDMVRLVLFEDDSKLQTPAEFQLCLNDEPDADTFYKSLSETEQRFYIHWISDAKREETRVERMAKAINRLALRLKFHDKE